LELEASRGILSGVFGARLQEVDEMIWSRFKTEDKALEKRGYGLRSSGWKANTEPHIGRKKVIHDSFI